MVKGPFKFPRYLTGPLTKMISHLVLHVEQTNIFQISWRLLQPKVRFIGEKTVTYNLITDINTDRQADIAVKAEEHTLNMQMLNPFSL